MTRVPGKDSGVYFKGYDLSGRSRSWDRGMSQELIDVTGFRGTAYRQRIGGVGETSARLSSFWDTQNADEIDAVLSGELGSDPSLAPILILEPSAPAFGEIAFAQNVVEVAYNITSPVEGVVSLEAEFVGVDGEGFKRCWALHPLQEETATVTGPNLSADVPFRQIWKHDGASTWTDVTGILSDTIADIAASADLYRPAVTTDVLYLGHPRKFSKFTFGPWTLGTVGVVTWEYWNGTSWAALGATGTPAGALNFTVAGFSGAEGISWTPAGNWAQTDVNGIGPLYWIRGRATTAYTVAPKASYLQIVQTEVGADAYMQVTAASGGSPTLAAKVQDSADGTTFADLTGLTFTTATSAPNSQRVSTSLTAQVRRFLRVLATIGGTTPRFTFWLGVARK